MYSNSNGFGASGKPMRSSTMKHIDALFNALSCLVGFFNVSYAESLLTALSIAFQRIQGLIISDPGAAISELKRCSSTYVAYIRGPAANKEIAEFETRGIAEGDFAELASVTEALKGFPILGSIIALRRILYGSKSSSELMTFDRIVFALLSIHRLIVLPPVYDYTTITSPHTVRTSEEERKAALAKGQTLGRTREVPVNTSSIKDSEILAALTCLGISPASFRAKLRELSANQQHYFLGSAGPNGPSTWTAFSDAFALLQLPNVWQTLCTYAEKTRMQRFINDALSVSAVPSNDAQVGTPMYCGRIHTFEEWGGKTRNVAIVDYWTQLIFTPLHDTIFHFLSLIHTDATFDQNAACSEIKAWTKVANAPLFSFDLTAATDRLPAEFQGRVLSLLTQDSAIGNAWVRTLQERPYRTVDYQEVMYAVGLPMGAKSNWAMLALVHHIIIQIAAERAKVNTTAAGVAGIPRTPAALISHPYPLEAAYSAYKVCGDDSVMFDSKVATQYQLIISSLGLTINLDKSVVPGTGLYSAAEFCKRIFINGSELTMLPVKLIVKTTMNGRLAPQLQSMLQLRGLALSGSGLMEWMAALIDQESWSFLLILNLLPTSITGLHAQATVPSKAPKLSHLLSDEVEITDTMVTQGYTYTASVEELKRLDALLRQTEAISKGIEQKLLGFDRIDLSDLGWADDVGGFIIDQVAALGEIGHSHPVVQAASAETSRVINMLAQLAAGSTTVSSMARARLLDSFRNALASAWADSQAARAQADRTLIQKTLDSLASLITTSIHNTRSKISKPASLNFTTMLSYLQRVWMVRWDISGAVTINTVKSKVLSSSAAASTVASTYSTDIPLVASIRRRISSDLSK